VYDVGTSLNGCAIQMDRVPSASTTICASANATRACSVSTGVAVQGIGAVPGLSSVAGFDELSVDVDGDGIVERRVGHPPHFTAQAAAAPRRAARAVHAPSC
jgi:hypothetical protein